MARFTINVSLVFLAASIHYVCMSVFYSTTKIHHYPSESVACKTYEMTKIDCSNRSLIEVPVLDQHLTTLLDLSHNFLMNITDSPFEKLRGLRGLNLEHNEISYLCSISFRGLHSLEQLSLLDNKLVDLPKDVFKDLYNLKDLLLAMNYFTTMPSHALEPLHSLRQLSFANVYGSIPEMDLEGFQKLQSLNKLYLFTFGLETMNASALKPLQQLPLEEFGFAYTWKNSPSRPINKEIFARLNGITNLTTMFSVLPALESLHTPLKSLILVTSYVPVEILNETSFQILQKWNNSLIRLQLALGYLQRIEGRTFIWIPNLLILDLDNNQIHYLAKDAFNGLGSLKMLILSRNSLAEVPDDALQVFKNSASLQHLDLSSNKIRRNAVNRTLLQFPSSLTYLNITISFKAQTIPLEWIAPLQSLKHLTLTAENLDIGSGVIIKLSQSLPSLQTSYISKFKNLELEESICTFFPALKQHVLINVRFRDKSSFYAALLLQSCASLKKLEMSDTLYELKSLDKKYVNMTIPTLEILKLAGNKLSSMKLIFFIEAPKLTELDLSENTITSIDEEIADKYPSLISLNVQDNEIASLSGLEDLVFLQKLSAAWNKITEIPAWFVDKAGTFKTLDLRNNPFQCTCNIEPFRKWILSDKQVWLQPGKYACASPENLNLMSITAIELDCRSKISLYLSTTIPSVFLFCTIIMIIFRYRWHIKYILFLLYRNCCIVPDIADDFEMLQLQYHAYVAYNENSAEDEAWVMNDLQPNMEEGPEPLQLCIKKRDFIPGHFLLDSIDSSIYQSRKTILVLSPNFVESEWCYHEMRMAEMRLLEDNLDVLVLVLLNEIPENKMTLSLRHILCRKDYLKWPNDRAGQNLFWRRLRQEIKGPLQVDRCFHM